MPSIDGPTQVDASKPQLNVYKTGFVVANDAQFQRTVIGLLAGDTLINAWLTIKTSPAASDQSGAQVSITQIASNQGIIVGNLATFNLAAAVSALLESGPLYYYDIKVQVTPSNNIYTVEQGFISFEPEVTDQPIAGIHPIQDTFPPASPPFLTGANPPPNGNFASGTRYIVVPLVEGMPAEWGFTATGFWRVLSVCSYGA
jgi:hypothetical protein